MRAQPPIRHSGNRVDSLPQLQVGRRDRCTQTHLDGGIDGRVHNERLQRRQLDARGHGGAIGGDGGDGAVAFCKRFVDGLIERGDIKAKIVNLGDAVREERRGDASGGGVQVSQVRRVRRRVC
eukprot:3318983-Pleurochrysis_carterae.AAC.1